MKEKILVAALHLKGENSIPIDSYRAEIEGLVKTAGGQIVGVMVQSRERPDPATFIGKGKVQELKHLIEELEPDLVLFSDELSPAQLRNLEKELPVRIIDRTMLILDIFSQRARSMEGKLQVELASLEYHLPRLIGAGKEMSRTGGGIGTRGAGEQQLEMDRRQLRARIREIKRQMEKIQKTRKLQRKNRQRTGIKVVSLVGYTNAGKSSLFNTLCRQSHSSRKSQVEADDLLFKTLDITTRKIEITPGRECLISDTVGFIQNLPHHLVAAFRSTLEEAIEADLLLHIVDRSDPDYLDKIAVVEEVLNNLGAPKEKIFTVFNKSDLLFGLEGNPAGYVSARTGNGIKELKEKISEILWL